MDIGRTFITLGGILICVGLFILFKDQVPGLKNLGRLPGDFSIERPGFSFYFPLTTSILISLIVTLLLAIFRRP